MKNITALAFLVIINCAFIINNSLFGQEAGKDHFAFSTGTPVKKNRYTFSVSPQAGIVYGQAFEYVYPLQGQTKAKLLSELKWDMKPVFYTGLQLDFEPSDTMRGIGFFSSMSFKIGIPKDSGIMEDRDWQSAGNNTLTNFSSHTNRTNNFYILDAALGVSLPIKSIICIKPFISGSWTHFSFSGRDGYYEYVDFYPPKGSFSGDVIKYKQDWFLAAAGLSVATNIFYPFTVDLSFQISPLTYCIALDEHLKTKTIYNDYTSMGLFFEPKLNFAFNMRRIALSLNAAYRRIGKTSGITYENEKTSDGYNKKSINQNKSGAGLSILDVRFLVKIIIF